MNIQKSKVDDAISHLVQYFSDNEWFINSFWGENEDRVRAMVSDAVSLVPPDQNTRVLDIGCFNGFASFIFGFVGYRVTASDEVDFAERHALLNRVGAAFHQANFNHLDAFHDFPDETFDIVVMGEVIEHVLNHPVGLMKNVARIMQQDGLLILTTPNPATIMNAIRLLRNRGVTRGSVEFADMPKVDSEGNLISYGGIHYREYPSSELDNLLSKAGFRLEHRRFIPIGASGVQSFLRRTVKGNAITRHLLHTRLLGATQYCLARRV